MWRIEYDRSVKNYIYDSYPYTEKVWQLIKSLRHISAYFDLIFTTGSTQLTDWQLHESKFKSE